jgi:S-adenosylmethionine:tRNA ribosyltransferase-isomerase
VHTDDFDFHLPERLIAQSPTAQRDESRLLCVDSTGQVQHAKFNHLIALAKPGDVFVFNDSKVIPARLIGRKVGSGGKAELLLIRPHGIQSTSAELLKNVSTWKCLGQSSKGFKIGTHIEFPGELKAQIIELLGNGEYVAQLTASSGSLEMALELAGKLPLPPYVIRVPDELDANRYQTVFANEKGSVAAPTAGLHFTLDTLEKLKAKGCEVTFVTLEVGPGTFMPVREGDISLHKMHSERAHISSEACEKISKAKRVIAVGTTVVRTLESMSDEIGNLKPGSIDTNIFITPGYKFKVVDSLFTNFHLPKSTLLMLVSAFLGREKTLAVYAEAVAQQYRFFSYGDAMFLESQLHR